MADFYDSASALRRHFNDLEEFVRNLSHTTLKPPMPPSVYYTTPEIVQKLTDDIARMKTHLRDMEDEVSDLEDELEDFQSRAK